MPFLIDNISIELSKRIHCNVSVLNITENGDPPFDEASNAVNPSRDPLFVLTYTDEDLLAKHLCTVLSLSSHSQGSLEYCNLMYYSRYLAYCMSVNVSVCNSQSYLSSHLYLWFSCNGPFIFLSICLFLMHL